MRLSFITPILFSIVCLGLLDCHTRNTKESDLESQKTGTIRTIVFHADSGVSYKHRVALVRNLAKNLGLPVLTGGYPGLHIRVWAWDSTNTKWVIDLKKSFADTSCTVLSYTGGKKDTINYIYIHEQKNVRPKSSWTDFFNSLEKLHIPEMRKTNLFKDRESGFTTMSYVVFEIDEPNQYRLVEYPDPLFFRKEDEACNSIDEFFRYFNKEMGTSIYDAQGATNE